MSLLELLVIGLEEVGIVALYHPQPQMVQVHINGGPTHNITFDYVITDGCHIRVWDGTAMGGKEAIDLRDPDSFQRLVKVLRLPLRKPSSIMRLLPPVLKTI